MIRSSQLRIPGATYRLQFHRTFTLTHARAILDYLHELGVTDVYASPLFQAGADSTHGYDVCCFDKLNSNIGTDQDFKAFTAARQEFELGLLLDMVPNHMGAALSNGWWLDVLEHGPSSRYAAFFDIDWQPPNPALHGKVLLPVLGDHYGNVLARGELKLTFATGKFWISYYERNFPVNTQTLPEPFASWTGRTAELPELESALASFNGIASDTHSFLALHRLIQKQHYRLAFWRVAAEEINYRRFFDVTELVSLRMDREEVFRAAHKVVFEWLERGAITGLRIDHPDGLRNPRQYFERLQSKQPVYVVAEKILSGDEHLPGDWPVHGPTGYDFLNQVNGLFVDAGAEAAMDDVYAGFVSAEASTANAPPDFHRLLTDGKKRILETSLASELNSLTRQLQAVAAASRAGIDFTFEQLKFALKELIAAFPVYRTYLTDTDAAPCAADRAVIESAVEKIRGTNAVDSGLLNFLESALTLELLSELDAEAAPLAREVLMRYQQLTGPVTAKGLEDTAFYNYHRLISLNEVGGEPARLGVSIAEFHRFNARMTASWPNTLLATATHDTKRGEDARARINVLSELPGEWADAVTRWKQLNADKLTRLNGTRAPDANDEYLLYQSLIGALPPNSSNLEALALFRDRAAAFMLKAIREAKANTSWLDPNPDYERAVDDFTRRVLTDNSNNLFLDDLRRFVQRIGFFGRINSLAQTVLKLTAPGVPDTYQGTELWDFSFVDPDNRRPVDFQLRRRLLAELRRLSDSAESKWRIPEIDDSGRAKLFVIWRTLHLRRRFSELFKLGAYVPLAASGTGTEHVISFARREGSSSAIAIVPRLVARLLQGEERLPVGEEAWADTELEIPKELAAKSYRNIFAGTSVEANESKLRVAEVLKEFPVAVLEST